MAKKALPNIKPDAAQALIKPGAEDFMVDKNTIKPSSIKEESDTAQPETITPTPPTIEEKQPTIDQDFFSTDFK